MYVYISWSMFSSFEYTDTYVQDSWRIIWWWLTGISLWNLACIFGIFWVISLSFSLSLNDWYAFSLFLSQFISLALHITRVEVHTVEDRRKEKSSKFLSGLKSRREKIHQQSQFRGRHSAIVDTIRIQMQASYKMSFS